MSDNDLGREIKAYLDEECADWSVGAKLAFDIAWTFARAAIEAMREPTDGMLDSTDDHFLTEDAAWAWRRMIDAALAEDKPNAS